MRIGKPDVEAATTTATMTIEYVLRRFGVFLLIVWARATLNFVMPRLAPVNPIRDRMMRAVARA